MSAPSRVFALLFLLGCATAAPLTCVRRPDRAGWRDALDAQDGNKETGIPREVYAVLTTPEEMDASFYNENPEFARVLSEALFAVNAACAKPDFVVNPLEFPLAVYLSTSVDGSDDYENEPAYTLSFQDWECTLPVSVMNLLQTAYTSRTDPEADLVSALKHLDFASGDFIAEPVYYAVDELPADPTIDNQEFAEATDYVGYAPYGDVDLDLYEEESQAPEDETAVERGRQLQAASRSASRSLSPSRSRAPASRSSSPSRTRTLASRSVTPSRTRSPASQSRTRSPGPASVSASRTRSPGSPSRTQSPGSPSRTRSPGSPSRTQSPGSPSRTRSPGSASVSASRTRTPVAVSASASRSVGSTLSTSPSRTRSPASASVTPSRTPSPGSASRTRSPGTPSRTRSPASPSTTRTPTASLSFGASRSRTPTPSFSFGASQSRTRTPTMSFGASQSRSPSISVTRSESRSPGASTSRSPGTTLSRSPTRSPGAVAADIGSKSSSGSKLTSGGIAGIVVGIVAFVAIVAFVVLVVLRPNKKEDKDSAASGSTPVKTDSITKPPVPPLVVAAPAPVPKPSTPAGMLDKNPPNLKQLQQQGNEDSDSGEDQATRQRLLPQFAGPDNGGVDEWDHLVDGHMEFQGQRGVAARQQHPITVQTENGASSDPSGLIKVSKADIIKAIAIAKERARRKRHEQRNGRSRTQSPRVRHEGGDADGLVRVATSGKLAAKRKHHKKKRHSDGGNSNASTQASNDSVEFKAKLMTKLQKASDDSILGLEQIVMQEFERRAKKAGDSKDRMEARMAQRSGSPRERGRDQSPMFTSTMPAQTVRALVSDRQSPRHGNHHSKSPRRSPGPDVFSMKGPSGTMVMPQGTPQYMVLPPRTRINPQPVPVSVPAPPTIPGAKWILVPDEPVNPTINPGAPSTAIPTSVARIQHGDGFRPTRVASLKQYLKGGVQNGNGSVTYY